MITGCTGGNDDYTPIKNEERRIFKIDVGNIPDEQIEDYIRKVAEKFKKATVIQPDLDCGVYPDNEIFLPENIEKKMPEQPDLVKIHDTLYPKSSAAHYMQVIPDSHFWTDLNQILQSIKHHYFIVEATPKENVYIGEPYLTKEYILIGLNNSKKHGYGLKVLDKEIYENAEVPYLFGDIDGMILYVNDHLFELKSDYEDLEQTIIFTLQSGINLTNGNKMEREFVYKRIDGERDYQDKTWVARRTLDGTPDEEKPVAEWINYIEYHLSKAKEKVYHLDTQAALAEIRKVAALAVRAMEIHGAPEREK